MSQTKNPTMTDNAKKFGDEIFGAGRKLYLFGIGTVAAAGDEASKLFKRMVSRGEDAEKAVHEDDNSFVNKATGSAKDLGRYVEGKVQGTVSGTLARAGVPSRSEIHDLIARVEDLTKKVEALSDRKPAE
jgi:poly(hydroxyalkanoate) granule-associated protein